MIVNPIIPIWLMTIICVILIILIIYSKQLKEKITNKQNNEKTIRQKNLIKQYIINTSIKVSIVVLLFIINLRFMIPNGETMAINSDLSVLFVIDTSISMRALDYNGNKERFEGVINDCCYIVDELSSCKFSIITFGDEARKVIPFTTDTDMVQAELKAINLEDDYYAKGSSMNLVKNTLEQTLKEEKQRQNGNSKFVIFFVSDGEITKEGEVLESFSNIEQYTSNGAVMGYGTSAGGKMVSRAYADDTNSDYYYLYYYDDNYNRVAAISKLDETNLKKIASDIGIDYIQMSKTSNINYKLSDIKQQISNSQTTEEKISSYKDIYYYFAVPLVILLIVDFIVQKRRMQ